MPEGPRQLVINTTPLIVLSLATGSLDLLRQLYDRVVVPREVIEEIQAGGPEAPGYDALAQDRWIQQLDQPQQIPAFLGNSLDRGEAAVIQAALSLGIHRVCIDEKVGRRVARLNGLVVTGSIGIIAKAKQTAGLAIDTDALIARLRQQGIWLGQDVEHFLRQAT